MFPNLPETPLSYRRSMLLHRRKIGLCWILALAFVAGCSEEAAESTPPVTAHKPVSAPVTNVARDAATPGQGPDQATTSSVDVDAKDAAEPEAEFEPPYKNRVQLFDPAGRPKRIREKKDGGDDLALYGFVSIEGGPQRAVLIIDGERVHLAVGESHGQVEVVAINYPNVTLQRGRRSRWTETIGNLGHADEE